MKKLKEAYYSIPGSTRFWNNLVILVAIIMPFISFEFAAVCAAFASILFLSLVLDGKEKDHYWGYITPLVWVLGIVFALSLTGEWIYNNGLKRFNTWLDKKLK